MNQLRKEYRELRALVHAGVATRAQYVRFVNLGMVVSEQVL